MTTLAALLLVAAALVAILYPLWSRVRPGSSRPSDGGLAVAEERYRSALADLQDTELDWENGSLSATDYSALRERYRRRAAETLRELVMRQQLQGIQASEVELEVAEATLPTESRNGAPWVP